MLTTARSIRSFIGAKDYRESRAFYRELGFEEVPLGNKMCLFRVNEQLGFYLQAAYVKDWVDNSMLFLEVEDLEQWHREITALGLTERYPRVRLSDIKDLDWGREFFLHDPSGILWHFGIFF